jgi:hypothetical protein
LPSGVRFASVGVLNEKYCVAPGSRELSSETIHACDGVLAALTSAL